MLHNTSMCGSCTQGQRTPVNFTHSVTVSRTFSLPQIKSMNRSTRNSKYSRLDDNITASVSSVDSNTLGRRSGLSSILPRPATVSPKPAVDFFPELQHIDREYNSSASAVDDEILMPEHIPPLPANLNNPYNTRKRSYQEAQVNSDITASHAAKATANKPIVIPGFVSKLYRMVDESTSNLIKWGGDGSTFVVTSPEDFSRHVLPLFFKHNNFSSFVRQLNMYGFHKVPHLQQGTMAASAIGNNESTSWEFSHVNFIRKRPDLLINVRRKIGKEEGANGSCEVSPISSTNSVLSETNRITSAEDFMTTAKSLRQELQFIHQQQNALRTDLISLQRDNQLLWNENLASRERHLQQQQVIDRILRFLASVFTTDGKLLTPSNTAGLNANNLSALQSNLTSSSSTSNPNSKQQRQLLIGNISESDDELRRQVLELISGADDVSMNAVTAAAVEVDENEISSIDLINDPTVNSDDFINFNHKMVDLETTAQDISKDISVVEDEFSKVLKNNSKNENENETVFDDLDFSSYLNCQSLE